MFEIIRVSKTNNSWKKNSMPITFPVSGIKFPGSSRIYDVIATCNHNGSLTTGHWFTKLRIKNDSWYRLDDLQSANTICGAPGIYDATTVLLLLSATDKLC